MNFGMKKSVKRRAMKNAKPARIVMYPKRLISSKV